MADPIGFALAIFPKEKGKLSNWQVISKRFDVPEEVIITLLRNWFKETEDILKKK